MLEFANMKNPSGIGRSILVVDRNTKAFVGKLEFNHTKGWVFKPSDSRDGNHTKNEIRITHMKEIIEFFNSIMDGD